MSIDRRSYKGIAFFDFDVTLLSFNSALPWVKAEHKSGYLKFTQMVEALYWILQYKRGKTNLDTALDRGVNILKGQKEEEFRERTHQFYVDFLKSQYRPLAKGVLDFHKEEGQKRILLTTASNYLAEKITEDLNLEGYLATTFITKNGILTGEVDHFAFNTGKLVLAKQEIAKLGCDPQDCYFYTDSFSDVPVLEYVGKPVVVNPDQKLLKFAKEKKWPIVDWGKAEKMTDPSFSKYFKMKMPKFFKKK